VQEEEVEEGAHEVQEEGAEAADLTRRDDVMTTGNKLMVALAVVLACALAGGTAYAATAGPGSGGEPGAAVAKKKKKRCKKGTKKVGRKCVKKRPAPSTPVPPPPPVLPDVTDDSATMAEDSPPTALNVLANDRAGITIASATDPANGTVAITGGGTGLTYHPDPDYCNAPPGTALETFTYTSNTGKTATVTVTVNCQDDAPVAGDDDVFVGKNSVDNDISFEFLLANDTDVDGPSLDIPEISNVTNGTAVLNAGGPGTIRFTPTPGFCEDVAGLDYTLSDGTLTDTGHVTIHVGAC
jgi:Big-like domain-containing protein